MSNHTALTLRVAAAAASSAAVLFMTVNPAWARTAPDPGYAASSTVILVPAPAPAPAAETGGPTLDLRQLGMGALGGLTLGSAAVLAAVSTRRSHRHPTTS